MDIKKNLLNKYIITKKKCLTKTELNSAFDIIKNNMIELGFNVTDEDEVTWKENLNLNIRKSHFLLFLIYNQSKIVGFIELSLLNSIPFLAELQFSASVKRTRIILYVINFLLNLKELKSAKSIEFSILKTNSISNKTFSHLGGKVILDTEKKYKYSITKNAVKQYLSKFNL